MLSNWSKFEKYWLFIFSAFILSSTFYFSYGGTDYSSTHSILLNWVISPVSAITGIVCVILVAKGKISNYIWGLVNCITYGYVAYYAGYYGDMIINLFYFLPFQFIGYYQWSKHLKRDSKDDVIVRNMSLPQIITSIVLGSILTVLVGVGLFSVDHWFVNYMKRSASIYDYIYAVTGLKFLGSLGDASTEILQFMGQILMTYRFSEQWIFWIATNIISIFMWVAVLVADKTSYPWVVPTIVMWVAYLVNSIYGLVVWKKEANV